MIKWIFNIHDNIYVYIFRRGSFEFDAVKKRFVIKMKASYILGSTNSWRLTIFKCNIYDTCGCGRCIGLLLLCVIFLASCVLYAICFFIYYIQLFHVFISRKYNGIAVRYFWNIKSIIHLTESNIFFQKFTSFCKYHTENFCWLFLFFYWKVYYGIL